MITGKPSSNWKTGLLSAICAGALLTVSACSTYPAGDTASAVEWTYSDQEARFTDAGLAELDALMKKAVEDEEVYGLSYILVAGDTEIARNYFGVKSLETQDPIAEDTIFRVYSMTKPITGVAMMMLWEEGKWKLDDPVTKYVPEFADLKVLDGTNADGSPKLVNVNRPPTMREVMSHTAGFAYGLGGTDPANTAFRDKGVLRSPDMDTLIERVADIPLLFQPGEDWFYSISVDIQGYIVEKLSGQKFGEFLDERIFTPLEMEDAAFYVPEDKYDRFSDLFTWSRDAGKLVKVDADNRAFRKDTVAFESGGGGLVMTLDDYANFSQMLLNGGSWNGKKLVEPETIELMATDVLPEGVSIWSTGNSDRSRGAGQGFGLDFGIVTDPVAAESEQGEGSFYWGGAAGTWFWIDPVKELYFVGMIQRLSGNPASDFDPRGVSRKGVYGALRD
ncbi:MAG: serine hydrolase [Ponticaulis sp.]|nr:serine hydrolase [Ponticaulis sp.]|tara:strand:+ start:560 stop:1903 length:1344 start_codon:yes stop_codon:yes gene_type:complete